MRTPRDILRLSWILACALAWAPAPIEAEQTPPAESATILETAIRSPLERSGDNDALAAAWLDAIAAYPRDYRCELLARRLTALRPTLRSEIALAPRLEELLRGPQAPTGLVRQILIDNLVDLCRLQGREEERLRLEKDRGFLGQWLVIGPFGKGESSLLLRPYPPEAEVKLDAVYRDRWQELRWRKAERGRLDSQVDPFQFVYPRSGVVYMLAQVRSEEARDAILHRGSSESIRIWLNGTLVADDDLTTSWQPSRRRSGVRLASGWNRILVKARTQFWVRLSDPADEPFAPGVLAEEPGIAIHPLESVPEPVWKGPFCQGGLAEWRTWVEALDRDAAGGAEDDAAKQRRADAHLGLALLYQAYAVDPLAVQETERAMEILPGDPAVLYHAGAIFRGARYLPANLSKNRSKIATDEVLAKDSGFVPAYERAARLLAEDEQYPKAVAKAREGLERNPDHLPLLLRLKAIFAQSQWEAEEIATVRKIEASSPASPVPAGFWASYYRERDNIVEAIRRLRAAHDLDRRQDRILLNIANLEEFRGDLEAAEASLRQAVAIDPDEEGFAQQLATLLAEHGRFDEALALVRPAAARRPQDPGPLKQQAEILDRAGRRAEAGALYAAALALEPGDAALRRYLEARDATGPAGAPAEPSALTAEPSALTVGDDAFWAPYDSKLEDVLGAVPTEGPLVAKASSVLILDLSVMRVQQDGSYSEYVHQAHRILTDEAKENLANVSVGDEVIALRTVTPTGETQEPVAAEGRRSYVMPGLAPGATIEVAYRTDHSSAQGRPFRGSNFFFQDNRFQSPFLLSRYVVLLPEGLDVGFLESRIGGTGDAGAPDADGALPSVQFARVEKTVTRLAGGGTAVVYEARNVPRLEPEPLMPAPEEYLPNVEILEKRTWGQVGDMLRDSRAGSTRLTPELLAAAKAATASASSQLERARALYDHVNTLIATQGGRSDAAAILLEKTGDRTILFKALLDSIEIPSRWAYLRPLEAYMPRTDWSWPRYEMFPYPYLLVEIQGAGPLYISLAERQVPFGRLPEYLEGGKALVVTPQGEQIVELPAPRPEEGATSTTGTLEITGDTEVTVKIESANKSMAAFAMKDRLRTLQAFQRDLALRGRANQLFPGAQVKSGELLNLDDTEKPLVMALSFVAPKALRASGEDSLLRAVFEPTQLLRRFSGKSRREHPFQFRGQLVVRDAVRVSAGAAHEVGSSPADVRLDCPLGSYALVFERDGQVVTVRRSLTLLAGRIAAADFPAFLDFCRKVDAAEQESIIFRKKA